MPWHERIVIARVVAILLGLGWGLGSAAAAHINGEPDLLSLPWLQVAVGVVIATWGGATATLGRYLAAAYSGSPFHWRAEAVRDGFVSVTVGSGSYFGGAWYGLHPWLLGLVLLLSGYLGVRILSGAAERLMAAVTGGLK